MYVRAEDRSDSRAPDGTSPSGLLIDADKAHARTVGRVLRSVLSSLETCESVTDVPGSARFDVVLANVDSLDDEQRALLFRRFADERGAGRLVLCTAMRDPDALAVLFGEVGVTNIVGRHEEVDGEELLVTVQKILRKDIFGIEKYFSWGVERLRMDLSDSGERDGVRDAARELSDSVGTPSRLTGLYCSVVDELTTNALYNAPVDAQGGERFSHLRRGTHIVLDGDERIEVVLCSDGRKLGCAVTDPFGSLCPRTIVDYLGRCFRRGRDQISERSGGAGLGIFTVYEASSQLVINIASGRRTEVIALIDIRGRFRDFAERPKSLNVFVTS